MRQKDIGHARRIHYGFLPRSYSDDTLDVAVGVLPFDTIGGDYAASCRWATSG